ncbi:MAG: hypothetical protein WB566_13555 [Terriglobales bacterium]
MVASGIPRYTGRVFFSGVLLFGLLAMTARNAVDPDLGWHLRTGQWIVETGHVPHTDPFSFTRAGHPWVPHEWLSDVVFYELWKHGGAAALIVFSAIVTTAGFMLLYLRCLANGAKSYWAAAATALGALAAAPSWGVRPQMFTFALASLLLWLIESGEHCPRRLPWIPPLLLLWLNLHAGFALALVLLLAYGAGLIIETATGDTPWQHARPIVVRVLLLLLVCLALVPLNPSGAQLYRYPFDTLFSSGMRSLIGEWHSPDFHEWLYRPLLLVWLLLLSAFAASWARPRGRVILPLLATGFAALDAVRHIPIFVLVATPVLAAALPVISGNPVQISHVSKSARRGAPTSSRLRPLFNVAVVILMAAFALVRWVSLAQTQDAREAEQFPAKAVAFLKSGDYPQKLFVYYDWGGYTIWKLYPEYRVFVDGRADLFGDLVRQSIRIVPDLRTGWREVLDGWKVDVVLIPPSCALAQALLLDPEWHVVFSDSKAIVLLRKPQPPTVAKLSSNPLVSKNLKKCSPEPPKSAKLRPIRIRIGSQYRSRVWGASGVKL